MKYLFLLVPAIIALLGAGCADFPTSYDRIEPDKPRLLDFIYEPAEAAPGDTVLLKAVFAGRKVTAEDLIWEASYNVSINEYGEQTQSDTVALELTPVDCSFSDQTSCIALRFVIPENIIENSDAVPDNWTKRIPDYYRDAIPATYGSLSKHDILQQLDQAATALSATPEAADEDFLSSLPLLLQYFTAPMQLFCTIRGGHPIQSTYSVRYNARFASLPQSGSTIPVNRNPVVDSIRIYTVEENPLSSFNPATCTSPFTFTTITGDTATIRVKRDCTYFFGVFTGNIDSTISIDAALGNGTPLPEQHLLQWYREFDQRELDEVAPEDLLQISGNQLFGNDEHLAQLFPSLDEAITGTTVWVQILDQFINELFRPQGSTLKELRLRFVYEDE